MAQALGCTELRLERQTVSWNIRGIESLFEAKLLPVWKLQSPSFETGGGSRKWHLELAQSKSDLLKCTLVEEFPVTIDHHHNIHDFVGGHGHGHGHGHGSQHQVLDEAHMAMANNQLQKPLSATTTTEPGPGLAPTSAASEMLSTAAATEVTSGAVINNLFIITRDGRLESFGDILEKFEETTGWKEWAGKFVEKRRKIGITEYIFGKDEEAYENAIPLNYLAQHQDRYLDANGCLDLQAELLFTSTIRIPSVSTASNNNNNENHGIESSGSIIAADDASIELEKNLNNSILAERLAGFLKASHLSDFTLECEGRSFPVHKIILEARAPNLLQDFLSRPRVLPNRPCNRTPSQIRNQYQNPPLLTQCQTSDDESEDAESEAAGDASTRNLNCGQTQQQGQGQCQGQGQSSSLLPNATTTVDNGNGSGLPSLQLCPCISPAFRSQSIIVAIDNIRSNILEIILQFIYLGSLSDDLDVKTLHQVSREAQKYDFHELTYMCFRKCLSSFSYKDGSPGEKAGMEVLLKDILMTANKSVFENRSLSLMELRGLHPLAFHQLDS